MHTDDLAAFLHAPAWQRFLQATSQTVERYGDGLYVKGNLLNKGTYWRGSRVAIDATWEVPTFCKKAWFIRLEPLAECREHLAKFGNVRVTDSIQPKQTIFLDLSAPEEELLAGMKSKHRYNIRVAERHGVQVEIVHADAAEHFGRFWKLLTETAGRHTFRTHDENHYKNMIELLAPEGMAHLAFATLNGQDLATLLLITYNGTATYLHGGSTQAHKEVMAPHLLHWQVITWAKSADNRLYDFWGTNAVKQEDGTWEPRANHPSTGTTRFKLGFGGQVIQYPGAFDLVLRPIPYTLYNGIRRIIRRQSSF